MVTRKWRIYGAEGHRQALSFAASKVYDFSKNGKIRIIEFINGDKTGTNDYTIIKITRETADECRQELNGQISDGFFENIRCGKIEEIF